MSDFKAKMHQIRFPLGSLQRSPGPLAVFTGPTSKGREGKGGGKGKGREGKRKVGEGKGWESWSPNWGVWIRQWIEQSA